MGNDRSMFVRRTKHDGEQDIDGRAGDSARGSLYIRMRAGGDRFGQRGLRDGGKETLRSVLGKVEGLRGDLRGRRALDGHRLLGVSGAGDAGWNHVFKEVQRNGRTKLLCAI